MAAIKILGFGGSLRTDSYNKKLVKIALEGAKSAGAETTYIDPRDFDLPMFDEDLEAKGLPADVKKLKSIFLAHQGMLISSPEYNSSISGVLKNLIDWVSRPVPTEKPLECFTGKVAGLVSASPGVLGGIRGLVHLRSILGNIGVIVLPQQLAVSKAHEAIGADGRLKDTGQHAGVEAIGAAVAHTAKKLAS